MPKKYISIITINYNNNSGLESTMESVLSQTSDDFEYIIIDGGSKDGSPDTIKKFLKSANGKKIKFWCSERDKGIYNAMNKGVLHATGEYCLFVNSGDTLLSSNTISSAVNELKNKNEDIIAGTELFTNGTVIKPFSPEKINAFTYMDSFLPHESTFIKTKIMKKIKYRENYRIASDFIFFFEAIFMNKCTYSTIPTEITLFNLDGISSTNNTKGHQEIADFYNKYVPSYVLDLYNSYRTFCEKKYIEYGSNVANNKIMMFIYKVFRKLGFFKH